jgi:hypothetical protein
VLRYDPPFFITNKISRACDDIFFIYHRARDSLVNPDFYAERYSFFRTFDIWGYQYMSGYLDIGTLWTVCNEAAPFTWMKYGPIYEEYKARGVYTPHIFEHFEYLTYEMSRMMAKTDRAR